MEGFWRVFGVCLYVGATCAQFIMAALSARRGDPEMAVLFSLFGLWLIYKGVLERRYGSVEAAPLHWQNLGWLLAWVLMVALLLAANERG